VKTAAEILPRYDAVFSAPLKALIARSRAQELFSNAQGGMLGDGERWFAPVGANGQLELITINPGLASR